MTAVEEPDEILDLVDWQLSRRSIIDNSHVDLPQMSV